MNKHKKTARRNKIPTEQGMTSVKKVKQKQVAKARLKLLGFNDDELKIAETGNISKVALMLVNHQLRLIDNVVVSDESKDIVHILKPYGDWKCTDFILALEDFQQDIPRGKYTTIQQCMENRYFQDCDAEDQSQLIDIANWYLYDTEQSKENS